MELSFHGAAGTVTGSKYLVTAGGRRVLVDCGLYQGYKPLRLRNWAPPGFAPAGVHAVVLTHAHLDHSGYLPVLVRDGFRGPVYCTDATAALAAIILRDSAHLNEQDAERANRYGYSKHHPALPLYTRADAEAAIARFEPVAFGRDVPLRGGVHARFQRAGHILGAASVALTHAGRTLLFSGDLGRSDDPTMPPPAPPVRADWIVIESTYGNRRHPDSDPQAQLADVIVATAARGGTLLVPAFAVGRTQVLLYHLERLRSAGRIPRLPIYLDSPMAIDASEIYCAHPDDHRLSEQACRAACGVAHYVRDVEESKALDADPAPKVIIAGSGMASGGRILHHLKRYAPEPHHTIVFTGYQAGGTRGAALLAGAREVKIHGAYVAVRAQVTQLEALSAHADADQLLAWLAATPAPPRTTFVTHGEPDAADALRVRIQDELRWTCVVPEHRDRVTLA